MLQYTGHIINIVLALLSVGLGPIVRLSVGNRRDVVWDSAGDRELAFQVINWVGVVFGVLLSSYGTAITVLARWAHGNELSGGLQFFVLLPLVLILVFILILGIPIQKLTAGLCTFRNVSLITVGQVAALLLIGLNIADILY